MSEQGEDTTPRRRWNRLGLDRLTELNVNERLTALLAVATVIIGISSLVVSCQALQVASDSSDLKTAITKLSELATQTKRQADATNSQLAAVREQVAALKEQAAEAKRQTQAISEQTTAIKQSAESAVQSAGAQIESARAQTRAANAAAASQRPGIALTEVTMAGFDGAPEKEGVFKDQVKIAFNYKYTNVGGTPWELIDNAMVILTVPKLPERPDYSLAQHMRGDGLVIPKGHWMNLTGSPYLGFTKLQAQAVNEGKLQVFMYGIITYRAPDGDHRFCYAYQIPIHGGASTRYVSAGGPAYHCDS